MLLLLPVMLLLPWLMREDVEREAVEGLLEKGMEVVMMVVA